MNDFQLRRMIESDLPAADRLREIAGWNQTLNDWRLLLALEPKGCFVALQRAEVIGTVTTTTYGRTLAWIGMMLVHPDHRRGGVGTSLMGIALESLKNAGVQCVRLDATPAGRPLYERLGFVSEWSLTRHERSVMQTSDRNEYSCSVVRDFSEGDWPAVEALDARGVGLARTRVLRDLARHCRRAVVGEADGRVVSWGMIRPGAKADYIGPIAGEAVPMVSPLMAALVRHARDRLVVWDVPDDNEAAVLLARDFNFRPVRQLTRMRRGATTVAGDPRRQFAIADPALG
jgi:predicted N-acetyltransferase YhbS